jgi:hypothetical protein
MSSLYMDLDPKKVPYKCGCCDYTTSKKSQWKRHIKTKKHKMMTNDDKMMTKKVHRCKCGKIYKHRQGLYVHKQKCSIITMKSEICTEDVIDNELVDSENITILLKTILKENRELKAEMKNMKINNITNNNQKISINVFLNEYCKDAMSLTDFVNKISVSLKDLTQTRELGFVDGISNVILKSLKDMPSVERPIHSSDVKRAKFFIKNEDGWKKDNNGKNVDGAITKIKMKHLDALSKWESENPEYNDNTEKLEEWQELLNGISSGEDIKESIKNKNLVKKNIAESCSVKKAIEELDK